jgi:hypothetical protein
MDRTCLQLGVDVRIWERTFVVDLPRTGERPEPVLAVGDPRAFPQPDPDRLVHTSGPMDIEVDPRTSVPGRCFDVSSVCGECATVAHDGGLPCLRVEPLDHSVRHCPRLSPGNR